MNAQAGTRKKTASRRRYSKGNSTLRYRTHIQCEIAQQIGEINFSSYEFKQTKIYKYFGASFALIHRKYFLVYLLFYL